MKFKTVVLLLFLLPIVFAQSAQPRVMEPIRITLSVQGEKPHNEEIDKLLRVELRKRRGIVIVSQRANYDIQVATMSFTGADVCDGYTSAVVVTCSSGRRELSIYVNKTTQSAANRIILMLENIIEAQLMAR